MTTNTLSTTVTHADVQNLPLAERNVLNFALLVPGAQTAGTDPRQSTYNGMPGATLNITVDGINNNSGAFRSGGTSFFATVPPPSTRSKRSASRPAAQARMPAPRGR